MKNSAIFRLLDLLRKHTDQQHRLTAKQMLALLESEYGIKLNRRTLKCYLDELVEAGYPLNYTSRKRYHTDGSVELVQTNWYLDPQFEPSEVRLLIDLIHAVPTLPPQICSNLKRKLVKIAPPTAREMLSQDIIKYLHRPPAQQMLFTVDMICDAIRHNCMVQFKYCSCAFVDGEIILKPRTKADGKERLYLVSPYGIVVSNGRYYLVCCKEPHTEIAHYRIDRITDIELLPQLLRVPLEELQVSADEFPRHPAERLYMYAGKSVACKIRISQAILGDVIDWFGEDADISEEPDGNLLVSISAHPTAMKHWVMQYGGAVELLEPQSLRAEIGENIRQLKDLYCPHET